MSSDPETRAREALAARLSERKIPADVVDAFRDVPRHEFVPASFRQRAYEDSALPLSLDQTISQPTMIAIMLRELGPERAHRALEVGAGSGYAAALLGRLVAQVDAFERLEPLARGAQATLTRVGADNVTVLLGDGTRSDSNAQYDRILVSAGAREIPAPLLERLGPGGRIVIPVDHHHGQILRVGDKRADGTLIWRDSVACLFVPLVTN